MLRYQKTDISEGIDVNKTNASKKCEVWHYWFFKDFGFKFEEHDLLTIVYSLKHIAKSNARGNTYRCILMDIS